MTKIERISLKSSYCCCWNSTSVFHSAFNASVAGDIDVYVFQWEACALVVRPAEFTYQNPLILVHILWQSKNNIPKINHKVRSWDRCLRTRAADVSLIQHNRCRRSWCVRGHILRGDYPVEHKFLGRLEGDLREERDCEKEKENIVEGDCLFMRRCLVWIKANMRGTLQNSQP